MIPGMNDPKVFESLEKVGSLWTGKGVAVECGTWFGASTVALARGLRNTDYHDRFPIYCFDKWQANLDEVVKAAAFGVSIMPGQDILPLARKFIRGACPYAVLAPRKGRIEDARWDRETKIEVLVLDAAKRNPSFRHVIDIFRDAFIPNVTILCLLDFNFYQSVTDVRREEFRIQEKWVEANASSLHPYPGFDAGSARFFLVTGKLEIP